MIQYDLTSTAMAQDGAVPTPPTEAELFAITLGLMLHADCGFDELTSRVLALTVKNRSRVIQILEQRAPSLARELGSTAELHRRLGKLVGIRITRCPQLCL